TPSGTFALLVSATVAYICLIFFWRDGSWVELAALGLQYLVLLPLILKYLGSARGARNGKFTLPKESVREVRILAALFVSLVLAYLLHAESSASVYGSRFHYEAFFAIGILVARGLELLVERRAPANLLLAIQLAYESNALHRSRSTNPATTLSPCVATDSHSCLVRENRQRCLFEGRKRPAHRIVQTARRALCSLPQHRATPDPRGHSFQHRQPWRRGRLCREALWAKIVEEGAADLSAAFEQAAACSRTQGFYFLNDATDPDLPAGPATIALEIFEQLPSVDTIVVPMGDTALIRGVAAAAKHLSPTVRIIGVQAEQAPSYFLSWKHGQAAPTETCNTIADGLSTRIPEPDNVRAICELVDEVVLVTDDQMLAAIRHLALYQHIIAEPAGAAATAALLHAKFQCGRHTVLLVTGANISPEVLRAAIC